MIVVTGAAGFIGSNLVKGLNERGETDILAVDNLTSGEKFANLVDCEISDFLDKGPFLRELSDGAFDGEITALFHQGACSDTMEGNGRYMMDNNYRYSVELYEHCQREEVPFIYASSAAVYGAGPNFGESRANEAPLNVYGYSKFLFDQYVRRRWEERTAQVVGLRYFNVYGPREAHKGRMASVAFHFFNQYRTQGRVKLFEGSGVYGPGEQRRDFVSVEDVVKVNLHFLARPNRSGIYNVGTGAAQTFNEVAAAVVNACRAARDEAQLSPEELKQTGALEYIPFPEGLKERYQSYTEADLGNLRKSGYAEPFLRVEAGVAHYVNWMLARASHERREVP